jgi:hypothetical protein
MSYGCPCFLQWNVHIRAETPFIVSSYLNLYSEPLALCFITKATSPKLNTRCEGLVLQAQTALTTKALVENPVDDLTNESAESQINVWPHSA